VQAIHSTPAPLLTEKAAAQLLGLSPATMRNWRCNSRGPVFQRLGRAVRYRREEIDRFIGSGFRNTTQADAESAARLTTEGKADA